MWEEVKEERKAGRKVVRVKEGRNTRKMGRKSERKGRRKAGRRCTL